MTEKPIRYTFKLQTGEDIDGPVYERWVRKLECDAQAELVAKRLSEENGGASIWIHRGGVRWYVRCGFVPT